ncbi:MAG TPA: hypothetical protein VI612_00075 [Candidatus Nanoarchaeia archaeon]|nr:hypothetical protein [Candidatus Nanoarchaeia archaeon]
MFSKDEKEYLKFLIKKELEQFRKEEKTVASESAVKFLKAEHDYGHFLEKLLEKLQ